MKTKEIVLGILFAFLMVFTGCEPEGTVVEENAVEVVALKGGTPPQDVSGRQHESVQLYQDDTIRVAFSNKTVEKTEVIRKWRAAINTVNTQLDGCIHLEILPVREETFVVENGINIGSTFQLEQPIGDLQGTDDNYIRSYITKYQVPSAYVANYGATIDKRIVDGGLITVSPTGAVEVIYELPFNLDELTVKYLDGDGDITGGQRLAGLETTFYSEYGYVYTEGVGYELQKVRDERLNLSYFPSDYGVPINFYASLGKTWQINHNPSIFTDVVMVSETLPISVFVRALAYELGYEAAATQAVVWDDVRALYCTQ